MSEDDNVVKFKVLPKPEVQEDDDEDVGPPPLAEPDFIAVMVAMLDELKTQVEAGQVAGFAMVVLRDGPFPDPAILSREEDVPRIDYGLGLLKHHIYDMHFDALADDE
jgi:hypothetical protein